MATAKNKVNVVSKSEKQASNARKDNAIVHTPDSVTAIQPKFAWDAEIRRAMGDRKGEFFYRVCQSGIRHIVIVASSRQAYTGKDGLLKDRKVYHLFTMSEHGEVKWVFDNGATLNEVYAHIDLHYAGINPGNVTVSEEDTLDAMPLGGRAKQAHQNSKPIRKTTMSPREAELKASYKQLREELALQTRIDKLQKLLAELQQTA
jgi:hypothetical protein